MNFTYDERYQKYSFSQYLSSNLNPLIQMQEVQCHQMISGFPNNEQKSKRGQKM